MDSIPYDERKDKTYKRARTPCYGFNICYGCRAIILLQGQPTYKIIIDGKDEHACRKCMLECRESK